MTRVHLRSMPISRCECLRCALLLLDHNYLIIIYPNMKRSNSGAGALGEGGTSPETVRTLGGGAREAPGGATPKRGAPPSRGGGEEEATLRGREGTMNAFLPFEANSGHHHSGIPELKCDDALLPPSGDT